MIACVSNVKVLLLCAMAAAHVVVHCLPLNEQHVKSINSFKSNKYDDLINEIRLRLLAGLVDQEEAKLAKHPFRESLESDESSSESSEESLESGVEKRSRSRYGETRSKVKLLHNLNHDVGKQNVGEHSRKIWEKNLQEKNKMYENLIAGH